MRKRRRSGGIFTNIFLAALILALYHAVQPDAAKAIPVAAPVYRGSGEAAALQFTVCWNAAALSDIMDILAENGIRATFAVSGEWAAANPPQLRRMAAEGHEIAAMGYSAGLDGGYSWLVEDIGRSVEAIEGVCGVKPGLYYAGGREKIPSALAARRLGLAHVDCTLDLLCARGSAADIISRLPEELPEGSILLMQPTAECAAALPGIISALDEKGLRAVCTGEVLA